VQIHDFLTKLRPKYDNFWQKGSLEDSGHGDMTELWTLAVASIDQILSLRAITDRKKS